MPGGCIAPLVSPLIYWLPWLEERRCGVQAFPSVIPYGTAAGALLQDAGAEKDLPGSR